MKVRTDLRAGQIQGMGDVVAEVTHTTGLDNLSQLYTQITGKDCGCDQRRQVLNQLFPINNSPV